MTLVSHCILQNDPDSAAISTSPGDFGKESQESCQMAGRAVFAAAEWGDYAARESLFARQKNRHSQPRPLNQFGRH
jgi:hypothetical protein